MVKYILKRLGAIVITLFILSIFVFALIHITPGDPARIMLGADASQDQVDSLTEQLGLNKPLISQYFDWIGGAVRGDLGSSYSRKGSVVSEIGTALGPTIELSLLAQILATVIAIPLGILASKKKGKVADSGIISFAMIGISIPSFLMSLLLVLAFSINIKIFPVAGYKTIGAVGFGTHLRYLVLPVISLAMMQCAMLTRMTRASMIDVINNDYIKTAKAKGCKANTIMYKHALRNAMIPILTSIGQSFATLLSGAAVVETVFGIPGVGELIVSSVTKRDYPMIQGIVLVVSLIYIIVNFIIDLLYGVIDPRIRVSGKSN